MIDTLYVFVAVYVLLNIVSFLMYVWDKHKAREDKWRTPEATLLLAALIGPFGAVAGMKLARHKTRKLKFKLVYVFLVIHVAVIAYLFWNGTIAF